MNTIEETIKLAGFGKKKIMAKQIQMFEERFADEGENLLAACAATDGKQQLYITDQRVLLHEIAGIVSNNEKSIPLKSVGSVNIQSQFLGATLEVISSGNKIIIDKVPVHVAQEIKKIIEHFQVQETKKETVTLQNDTFDIADEIRELKDLLDDGLITQEEFEAKKKQILNI